MNTDFRLSVGYFEHPKIMKLGRRLGDSAILSHIRLLRFTSMNKPDGVLSGMDAEDIVMAAGYQGDAGPFMTALLALKLVDGDCDGGYSLHDWEDWNPWAAGSHARTAKAKAAASARWHEAPAKDAPSTPTPMPEDATSINEQCAEQGVADAPLLSYPSPTPSPILSESLPSPSPSPFLIPSQSEEKNAPSELQTGGKSDVSPLPKQKKLPIPTEPEVLDYFTEKNRPELAAGFWDYWQSVGWKRQGALLADWKATVRTWISREDTSRLNVPARASPLPNGQSAIGTASAALANRFAALRKNNQ